MASGRCGALTAIFYDPYYNGEGGPLQAPESAPPWFKTIQEGTPGFNPSTSFADPLPAGTQSVCTNVSMALRG